MRPFGLLRSALAVTLGGVWLVAGCGTDAEGISQCRVIEAARCRAGVSCGLVDDLDVCLRYTRDHCLHGTATGGTPLPGDVRDCVDALEQAGSCADESRRMSPADCSLRLATGATATDVCDVIVEPEQARDCSFLMALEVEEEEPPPDDNDAGSDSG
jgi:hypothetical protein